MLELDLSPAIKELKKIEAKRVLIQIPEGLKVQTEDIIQKLEKENFEVISEMSPCFGACDIKVSEAKSLNCDAILHIGHNEFIKINEIPVIYLPLNYTLENFKDILKKLVDYLKKKEIIEIGLVTTAQFLNYVPQIKEELEKNKIKVLTKSGVRVVSAQTLGCNYSAVPNTKNIVYFGDGLFHPLGIHFSTQNEVIICNPFNEKIKELNEEKNKFLRQRILLIEKAKESNSFAIIVSSKIGQQRMQVAEKIRTDLIMSGKAAKIYSMDHISEDKLLGINAGAYISTACPRLSIDDFFNWKKPLINASEVKYLLGKEKYENYKLDLFY
jgi:2-(3-amino-3-carboxypropyl)histidine synthase